MRKPVLIGWREWVSLPDLGVDQIKAKADTGAATSALHVSKLKSERRDGRVWLSFDIHPVQRKEQPVVSSGAWMVDERPVRNTSGKSDLRPVIETRLVIGKTTLATQITLTSRDAMGFRMLLGRRALRRVFVVDAGRSFLHEMES